MNLKEYAEQNGQSNTARQLGVSQGLVWQWLHGKTRVTAERALQIEAVTGGVVTRSDLRPDLYPREQERRA